MSQIASLLDAVVVSEIGWRYRRTYLRRNTYKNVRFTDWRRDDFTENPACRLDCRLAPDDGCACGCRQPDGRAHGAIGPGQRQPAGRPVGQPRQGRARQPPRLRDRQAAPRHHRHHHQPGAIAKVLKSVSPNGKPIDPPFAELIVYPVVAEQRIASDVNKREDQLNATDIEQVVTGYKLAYLVTTRMVDGNTPQFHNTIVSATDGSVLEQWSMVQTVIGVGNSQYNGQVPISTTQNANGFQMIDATRGTGGTFGAMAITNANHGTTAGAVYTNSTNTWGDGQNYIAGGSTTNANGQTAAVNALWGLMNTYDMLKNTLGWQSLDGHNTATYIAAHVNTAYDNAYYSDTCKCMYIGDGSSFYSLGSIDVIGHEMSHGVTASTSNLTYRGESGGLNESSSDIGGEMVEAYARNGGTGTVIPAGNDWVMGKEISKTGTPLRYLYKPSKDGSSPDAWSKRVGSLDVHYSSGPNNRMFYFLSQGSSSVSTSDYYSAYLTQSPRNMTGIGNDKAYRIWFKAATTKFTSSTNYADARLKMIAAAQELYGVGSVEAKAVTRAYAAINVGTDIAE